jgi:uncharacterized protein (TIGR03435 family)
VHIVAQGVTMAELATRLSGFASIGRPVQDQTAIAGRFDFQFDFAPATVVSPDTAPPAAPSIFTALEERLGLQLRSATSAVEYVVIDRAERPTPN